MRCTRLPILGQIKLKLNLFLIAGQKTENAKCFFFYLFIYFFPFVQVLKQDFNVICQYFKCKAHVGKFERSNALELIVIQTGNQISGKYFPFFFNFTSNRQFDFDF